MFYSKYKGNKNFQLAITQANNLIQTGFVEKELITFAKTYGVPKDSGWRNRNIIVKRYLWGLITRRYTVRDIEPFTVEEYIKAVYKLQAYLVTYDIEVKVYNFGWSRRGVLASVASNQTVSFNVNERNINRSPASLCGSFFHESCHSFDNLYDQYFIGHVGNKRAGNEKTTPYLIGGLVNDFLKSL